MPDFAAIRTRCAKRFRDEDFDIVTSDEWDDYINDAYADVVSADPNWPFLESRDETLVVTAGTGTVDLPDDGWRVTAVYNATQDEAMDPLTSRSQYRRLYPDPDNNLGNPVHYRLRSNTLEVYPFAETDTTLHVDLFLPPDPLSLDADEPVFPTQFHNSLVSGAMAYAYEDDGNDRQADRHRAKFDRDVARMRDFLITARTESYPAITDDWY